MNQRSGQSIQFSTLDDFKLSGQYFPAKSPKAGVLIAPATGVRQHFYFSIARALAEQGYACLTFDYRDIGTSRTAKQLRDSPALKQDWGQYDMPAALDCLASLVPGLPISLLGHSAGAMLVGLMPNYAKLTRIIQVSAGSGYLKGVTGTTRPFAQLMFYLVVPVTCSILGYAPAKLMGWGEDLPKGVALQWVEWCSSPGYVSNGFDKTIKQHFYNDIQCPIVNVRCSDDPIASQANVEDILRLFPNADITRVVVSPADYGLNRLGHINIFRRQSQTAWPTIMRAIQGE